MFLGAALAALLLSACKSRGESDSGVKSAPSVPQDYTFVGCRPSVGECYNSCPDHRSQAKTESSYCEEQNSGIDGDVECYCFTGAGAPPADDPGEPQP